MRRRSGGYWRALACALLTLVAGTCAAADSPPLPAGVLALMERVADWQLAHPARYPDTDWTQAAGDIGMMALARDLSQPALRARVAGAW